MTSPYSRASFVKWTNPSWSWVFIASLLVFNGILAILYALDFLEVGFRAPLVPLIWSGAQMLAFGLLWVVVVFYFFWEQILEDRSGAVAVTTAGAFTNLLAFILFLIWAVNNKTTSKLSFDDDPRAFTQYANANVAAFAMYILLLMVALVAAMQMIIWVKTLIALDYVARSPGGKRLATILKQAARDDISHVRRARQREVKEEEDDDLTGDIGGL